VYENRGMKIFINYRREDEANMVFAIANALMSEFGVENVFYDRQAIKAGTEFPREIDQALESCRIFIPVIGRKWLEIMNKRQALDEKDYVLDEIVHAMDKGVIVLPILIDDTPMPSEKDLPPDVSALSRINAINITSDPKRLPSDIRMLIAELNVIFSRTRKYYRTTRKGRSRKRVLKIAGWIAGAAILVTAGVFATTTFLRNQRTEPDSSMVQEEIMQEQVPSIAETEEAKEQLEPAADQGRSTEEKHTEAVRVQTEPQRVETKPNQVESEPQPSKATATAPKADQVVDIDGNIYNTVTIGDQVWMAENLKVTHYANGDPILHLSDSAQWLNSLAGAYCSYDNQSSNSEIYGHLYNWYAVEDKRGLCPAGWHVPSKDEFKALSDYLGGQEIAGGKLKETVYVHWLVPNAGADNSTGFTALPGGERTQRKFLNIKWRCYLWSSTTSGRTFTYLELEFSNPELHIVNQSFPFMGFSVRCLKD
jgi:uncharacterized protein (TIGR02145 family)